MTVTPEMLKAAQLNSELGTWVCSNFSGAYDLLTELYMVMDAVRAQGDAEPVAFIDPQALVNFDNVAATREWVWRCNDGGLIPLYTHPPAAKVPEGWEITKFNGGITVLWPNKRGGVHVKENDERNSIAADVLHDLADALLSAQTKPPQPEEEGPDYSDGPEFEGWEERSTDDPTAWENDQ